MELLQGKTWESKINLPPKSQLRVDAPSFIPLHTDFVREVASIQEITTERAPATCSPAAVTSSLMSITVKLLKVLHLPARLAKIIKFRLESDNDISRKSLMFDPVPRKI